MKVLLIIDLQNDFLPGGSMPVPQGEAVIPLANKLQGCFKLVVATQDWHPANHKSFAPNHPGREPGEVVLLKKRPQLLWPKHCIQSARGSELSPALRMNRVNKVLRKGTDAEIDGLSGFFDEGHAQPTGLHDYLKEKKATEIYIMGLGLDYCVKATALDAVALGFKAFLIEDACRGWNRNPDDSKKAIEEIQAAGVTLMHSRELLQLTK